MKIILKNYEVIVPYTGIQKLKDDLRLFSVSGIQRVEMPTNEFIKLMMEYDEFESMSIQMHTRGDFTDSYVVLNKVCIQNHQDYRDE